MKRSLHFKPSIVLIFGFLISLLSQAQNFDIYVSDAGNFNNPPWQILKFDQNGQNPSVFINSSLNWPQDILFLEDQNIVLISNLGSGKIDKYNATDGTHLGVFASSISGPTRIKIGSDSLLYVLQWSGTGRVKRYELNGTYVDDFTNVGVPQSIGLDWDASGNLYVSSYNGKLIRKFDTAGASLGTFINSNLLGPTNIWFNTNGELLVADYSGTSVKIFSASGTYLGNFISGLGNSEGVDYLPNGNILIGNGSTKSVKLFSSSGSYLSDFVPSGSGNLLTPNAVRVRHIPSVSIPQRTIQKEVRIEPNIGIQFFVITEITNEIKSVDIFNYSGQLIDSVKNVNTMMWDGSAQADGNYTMIINYKDGGTSSHKIVIKK